MKRYIEFPLEDGSTILVETEEIESTGGVVRAARPSEVISQASQTFEQALDKVRPAATAIVKKLRGLSDPPDEMAVEFGIKLSADAGAFIASAGVEANYKVTLKWVRK
jgi:hypothetical protein